MDRGAWQATVFRVAESDMTEHTHTHTHAHTHTHTHTHTHNVTSSVLKSAARIEKYVYA